ncbi:MAG TPA: hypothetical protein VKB84_17255, partial [Candidatus Binataceae bacterium]|nr:hypothetical protein [Candidatus Binataceae bacterium]
MASDMEPSRKLSLRAESGTAEAEGRADLAPLAHPAHAAGRPSFLGDRLFRLSTMFFAALVLALLVGFAIVLAFESRLSLAKF